MNFYKGKCKQCGQCCKGISVSKSTSKWIEDWRKWLKENSIEKYISDGNKLKKLDIDGIFLAEHWIKIQSKTAIKLNPTLIGNKTRAYYKCIALVDNKCSKYNERPSICSGYPNYSKNEKSKPVGLLNKIDCGFVLTQNKMNHENE